MHDGGAGSATVSNPLHSSRVWAWMTGLAPLVYYWQACFHIVALNPAAHEAPFFMATWRGQRPASVATRRASGYARVRRCTTSSGTPWLTATWRGMKPDWFLNSIEAGCACARHNRQGRVAPRSGVGGSRHWHRERPWQAVASSRRQTRSPAQRERQDFRLWSIPGAGPTSSSIFTTFSISPAFQ